MYVVNYHNLVTAQHGRRFWLIQILSFIEKKIESRSICRNKWHLEALVMAAFRCQRRNGAKYRTPGDYDVIIQHQFDYLFIFSILELKRMAVFFIWLPAYGRADFRIILFWGIHFVVCICKSIKRLRSKLLWSGGGMMSTDHVSIVP